MADGDAEAFREGALTSLEVAKRRESGGSEIQYEIKVGVGSVGLKKMDLEFQKPQQKKKKEPFVFTSTKPALGRSMERFSIFILIIVQYGRKKNYEVTEHEGEYYFRLFFTFSILNFFPCKDLRGFNCFSNQL